MDLINRIFNRNVYLDGFYKADEEQNKKIYYIYESVFPDEATMILVQQIVNGDIPTLKSEPAQQTIFKTTV